MTHKMNQLIDKGGLDLTLDETTWPNSSYADIQGHLQGKKTDNIRSRKQDNTDGTSNIVLPCPGSWVIFLPLQGDNFTLSFLLRPPYNSGNNHLHTSENGTFVAEKLSCFDVISTSPGPSNRLLLSHPIKLSFTIYNFSCPI
jgi:hypothetical protein